MRALVNKNADPPKGWWYFVPETKVTIHPSYQSFYVLVEEVKFHYHINDLQVPEDLEARIEDQIAKRVPSGSWKEIDPDE